MEREATATVAAGPRQAPVSHTPPSISLSLAMIEYLVNLDPDHPPTDLMLARAGVPEDLPRLLFRADQLPRGWQDYPAPDSLALIGEKFVRDGLAPVLIVPSAVAPTENNWLLNPQHPQFQKIELEPAEPFLYDPRLLRRSYP